VQSDSRFTAVLPPLADYLAFCLLLGLGWTLGDSNIAACLIGALGVASGRLRPRAPPLPLPRFGATLGVALLLAISLRAGVLALLTQRWGWPPPLAGIAAVALGAAVTGWSYRYARSPAPADVQWRAAALAFVGCAWGLRVIYAATVELLPEEAYYWNYSRHLDFGYLDHPPLLAWLIRLGTAIFGQNEFGVRVGALGCGAIASLLIYRLSFNVFGERAALAALFLASVLPFFFMSGMLTTPDAPLTAAWAATLYFLERALIANQSRAWWGVGIGLGLGMVSKYTIALLVPVTIVYMLWDAEARHWWRRYQPYAAAVLALALFSPVLIWNAQHEWISFAFQTSRRLADRPQFALHKLLAAALVLLTPVGFLAATAELGRRSPPSPKSPPALIPSAPRARRLLTLAVAIPLTVFAVFSLRHEVKLDWTGATWVASLPLLAWGMTIAEPGGRGMSEWLRRAMTPTLTVTLILFAAALQYLTLGLPGVGYGPHIELAPIGWRILSTRVLQVTAAQRASTGKEVLIVGMDRYAIASEIAFYGMVQTAAPLETSSDHLFGGVGLMYERWTPAAGQEQRDLLLVALRPRDLSAESIEGRVDRLGPLQSDLLTRDGKSITRYYYRAAYGYHSNAAPRGPS
jgi:dolichol-phosphate mannosyltransferase